MRSRKRSHCVANWQLQDVYAGLQPAGGGGAAWPNTALDQEANTNFVKPFTSDVGHLVLCWNSCCHYWQPWFVALQRCQPTCYGNLHRQCKASAQQAASRPEQNERMEGPATSPPGCPWSMSILALMAHPGIKTNWHARRAWSYQGPWQTTCAVGHAELPQDTDDDPELCKRQ